MRRSKYTYYRTFEFFSSVFLLTNLNICISKCLVIMHLYLYFKPICGGLPFPCYFFLVLAFKLLSFIAIENDHLKYFTQRLVILNIS